MFKNLLLAQLLTCAFMAGLIWIIQLVHYPGFHYIDKGNFASFENFHSTRISFVVIPVMFAELITAIALYFYAPQAWKSFVVLNLIGLAVIWGTTMLISAPLHGELAAGYNVDKVKRLVNTNWIRTAAWTLRASALVWVVGQL